MGVVFLMRSESKPHIAFGAKLDMRHTIAFALAARMGHPAWLLAFNGHSRGRIWAKKLGLELISEGVKRS